MRASLVVNRRDGYAGFDQLDPATVYDRMVRRGSYGYGPAKVMSDAKTHAPILPFVVPLECL